jgi:hypothetical protein
MCLNSLNGNFIPAKVPRSQGGLHIGLFKTSLKCSTFPAPEEAMTGMETLFLTQDITALFTTKSYYTK